MNFGFSRDLFLGLALLIGAAGSRAQAAAVSYQQLHSFGFPELMGELPGGPPIQASDGFFYGTAGSGGGFFGGGVFLVEPGGTRGPLVFSLRRVPGGGKQ